MKNAASVVKQSKPVFCALQERFIIQNVSSVPTVNAFWMEFLLLKIQKKELIALPAIKSKSYPGYPSRRTRTGFRGHKRFVTNPKNSFYRLHSPKCFKCGKPICQRLVDVTQWTINSSVSNVLWLKSMNKWNALSCTKNSE